jgi:hypothetical protein
MFSLHIWLFSDDYCLWFQYHSWTLKHAVSATSATQFGLWFWVYQVLGCNRWLISLDCYTLCPYISTSFCEICDLHGDFALMHFCFLTLSEPAIDWFVSWKSSSIHTSKIVLNGYSGIEVSKPCDVLAFLLYWFYWAHSLLPLREMIAHACTNGQRERNENFLSWWTFHNSLIIWCFKFNDIKP